MSNLNSNTQAIADPFLAAMTDMMPNIETCKYSELNNKANKLETARTKCIENYIGALELFNEGTVKQQYGLIVKDKANEGNFVVKLKYGIYNLDLGGVDSFNNITRDTVTETIENIVGLIARNASNDEEKVITAA